MGRPSTSSEVMIAPWLLLGLGHPLAAAARHAAFVRENAGRARGRAVRVAAEPGRPRARAVDLGEGGAVPVDLGGVVSSVSTKATAESMSELSTASRRPLLPSDSHVNASSDRSGCRAKIKLIVRRTIVSRIVE